MRVCGASGSGSAPSGLGRGGDRGPPGPCPPRVPEPRAQSEEAGAPQAAGLAQLGRQRAAHVLGGGADALGSFDRPTQGLVELLQVLQVQLDGVPGPPGRPGAGSGGPLSGCSDRGG